MKVLPEQDRFWIKLFEFVDYCKYNLTNTSQADKNLTKIAKS